MAAITTLSSSGAWSPVVHEVAPQDAIPDALILQTSTVAGTVEGDAVAVHCQYVDDATAGFVAEGAAIDEAAPSLSEAVVFTGKIAQLLRLSREQFIQPNASELLSNSVARAVTKAGDLAYLQQAKPTSPAVTPPAGLLNITGIVNGGAVADDLDVLVDTLATVASNGGLASHILISPTAWASLRKFKIGTDFNSTLLGTGATDAQKYLLDLPVIVSAAVPANTGLVIDKTAVVSAVGPVAVATSDQAYFNSDSVAVRCTWRFGANVVKPNRIAKFTVTAPTGA
ncbi:phage major capsid protein [Gordonia sp. (in: high G+C Gram-positive bacteria)]|uniref:phage major capsid protein n=1 Tax=Gordonia sp. (in: high G+C Gram-positive bacteria) TaxID=84139 RepID=UPI00262E185D|nr:phage major capsid protein [Gordonia sp. (in: high G+C Gram-positive bacteria)]